VVGSVTTSTDAYEGKALKGDIGTALDVLLRDAGFELKDIRFTNAVRCEVPLGRGAATNEIDACRTHLKTEIHTVKPCVIIALGDTALRALCKVSGITPKRGTQQTLHELFEYPCPVFPTWHPMQVLRYPQLRATVLADLRRARDCDEPPDIIPFSVNLSRSPSIPKPTPFAFDIETNWPVSDDLTLISVSCAGRTVVAPNPEGIENICARLVELANAGCTPITHNGWAFDYPKLQEKGLIPQDFPLGYDTMLLAYLIDETQPLGLEPLAVKYLGVRGWKDDKNALPGSPEHLQYGARDATYTLRLYEHFRTVLGERIRYADEIVIPLQRALTDMSRRGVYVNGAAVRQVENHTKQERESALKTLRDLAGDSFNPNSTQQITKILGVKSTSKQALAEYNSPFVHALFAYRSATKRLSTYIKPYLAATQSLDGRVHPTYKCFKGDGGGTVTGRTSARNPNVQNLDRTLKNFFGAPPGKVLAQYDYSAIEFRIAGFCARESTIIRGYANDLYWDPHTAFAKMLYGTETITKEMRQTAKSANFSQLYLGNDETLYQYARGMGVSLSRNEALRVHKMWHSWLPGFDSWYDAVAAEILRLGYVETAVGFRRHFGDPKTVRRSPLWKSFHREAVNVKVQNLALAVAALGVRSLHEAGYALNLFVHDSVGIDFTGMAVAGQERNKIARLMCIEPVTLLARNFGVELDVPLAIDCSYTEGK
jgi:uracil-DNA glycosylase family 4